MPDPARPRRAPKPPKAERPDKPEAPKGPLWARAVHVFYDPIFDIRSRSSFQTALDEFVDLPVGEREFHETHLLYRVVQGLEGIQGVLQRIEKKLDAVASTDLSALEHLAPIRAALEEIARGQSDLIQAAGFDGEEEEEEEKEEDEDELGELEEDEDPGEGDPDFIYDTVPEDEPEQPRRPKRQPRPTAAAREDARPPARAEAPRAPRVADPERESLVGDLVPATEGPHGAGAGDR